MLFRSERPGQGQKLHALVDHPDAGAGPVEGRDDRLDVELTPSAVVPGHTPLALALLRGRPDLAALLVGSLPGIWLGARLTRALPEAVVRGVLCLSLLGAGIKVLT